jgi:hypothetical protein
MSPIAVNEPRSNAAAGEGQVHSMYDFANGPTGAVSLLGGSEPPLSPATVGRSPSFLEAPVALKPMAAATSTTTLPVPAPLPAPLPAPPAAIAAVEPLPVALEALPAPIAPAAIAPLPAAVVPLPVAAEMTAMRLVVRMLGGEELELGTFASRGEAVEAAKELVGRFSTAEDSGDWPEMDGRFIRPASVASIDVLVAE